MSFEIDMSALDEFLQRIEDLQKPDVFAQIGRRAAQVAGLEAEKAYTDAYPVPRSTTMKAVRGKSFLSNKQRRWFFASLRDGKLKLPYRRTGGTGQSLVSAPFATGKGAGFHIGTNSKGAIYVIGEKKDQAAYHQDWWPPLPDRIKENMAQISEAYHGMFIKEATVYFRGGS